ncbi:hypothetical protein MUK42_09797 [Musa troglodytarum]|uniref:Uncharacterized protein n=1 Tax=Musa troglodytarum TaxID=320322 RepID=A0A9E7FDB3_9LILI|nr:hypothetical protein MUK42_09797 [Musa troglodytarum]
MYVISLIRFSIAEVESSFVQDLEVSASTSATILPSLHGYHQSDWNGHAKENKHPNEFGQI